MTNTYTINVTKGQEFSVADEIRQIGLNPMVPVRLASRFIKEKGAKGGWVWYDVPYLPKFMACVIPAIYYRDVCKLKHVIGKPLHLSKADIRGQKAFRDPGGVMRPERPGLTTFLEAVEKEYADMKRKRANAEYECKYTPGQALDILSGPFEGFSGPFRQMIDDAKGEYLKLRMEVEIFGRATEVDLDPDMVGTRA